MTTVDWIIVAFLALMAVWGYALGVIVSALSLIGFTAGAFAGSRLAPLLLAEGSRSPYAPLFTLLGALIVGTVGALVLEEVGSGIRRKIPFGFARWLDGAGGAALVTALGLGLVWVGASVALQTPGPDKFRKDIQRSTIVSKLNAALPPAGPILNSIARFDPFPEIRGPQANVPMPTARILRDDQVEAARRSIVRIQGTACGLAVEGSGWVADPGVVVTNAHVVAGEDDTTVETAEGDRFDAEAIAFEPRNDVAALRVPGLVSPALAQRRAAPAGEAVAILGYPENGPYTATAARLGTTGTVISVDAYGSGPVRRRMTALRGHVRPGNSGGPAVDRAGRVVATVFAGTTRGPAGGFAIPGPIVARVVATADAEVDTGPCAR